MHMDSASDDLKSLESSILEINNLSACSSLGDNLSSLNHVSGQERSNADSSVRTTSVEQNLAQHLTREQKSYVAKPRESESSDGALNISVESVGQIQREIDKSDREQRRKAEERFKETYDPRAFEEILAPFLETEPGDEVTKPLWTWIPEAQRWSCKSRGKMIWCPTLDSFS